MHIGLFDSGVGGLTVLKELFNKFPNAQYTYLGDTARLPYGNKAPETLEKYSQENMEFLQAQGVDAIVIACHSASSVCLGLKDFRGTPVFNVIAPGCEEAVAASSQRNIGIMATKATIKSQVYTKYIEQLDPKAQVTGQECPLLVPLVEEGHIDDEITEKILQLYLSSLKAKNVDTILLGCTHYPILQQSIQNLIPEVKLINPASAVAEKLKSQWADTPENGSPSIDVYLTDHAPHFLVHARSLLGTELKYLIHE